MNIRPNINHHFTNYKPEEVQELIVESETELAIVRDQMRDELLFGEGSARRLALLRHDIKSIEERIFDYEDFLYTRKAQQSPAHIDITV